MSENMTKIENKTNMVMVQGCRSNSGKSTIAASLCKIYADKGFRVSPFKGWNMGSNSYKTDKEGEMGIAQAVQARAAGTIPDVNMQPLLVKPSGNGKTELLVKGKPYLKENNIKKDKYLKLGIKTIEDSLDLLKKEYDLLVLEGSGSPVEINVKDRDLANMKTALLNNTPVILVADIERGGVFASIIGTMELLEPEEKDLIKGFIINKFHGDKSILQSGIDYIEERTGKPVLGVLPYIEDINLPEEDTISLSNDEIKKLDSANSIFENENLENDFQKLAKIFKNNIDMEKVDNIIFD
ncbi:MAG: cobyric acid synthase [Bacillota bacterium]